MQRALEHHHQQAKPPPSSSSNETKSSDDDDDDEVEREIKRMLQLEVLRDLPSHEELSVEQVIRFIELERQDKASTAQSIISLRVLDLNKQEFGM